MKFKTGIIAIAASLVFAMCASPAIAYADPDEGSGDGASLSAQASYVTSYAILKSDGYLHRTNANHTQDYGTLWGDNQDEMWAALNSVTTLYIDSDVTSLSGKAKIQYKNGSQTINRSIEFTGNNLVTGPHNLQTVEFVLRNGENQLSVISGSYATYMFAKQESLTAVKNLDKTQLVNIPNGMFFECKNLTSVSLPKTALTVGDFAFRYCSNLSSVTIPSGVATINREAFQDCTILKSVDLPETVKTIGNNAFADCSSLAKVIMRSATVVNGYSSSFRSSPVYNDSGNGRIYVPNNILGQYKSEDLSNSFRSIRDHFYPFFDMDDVASQTYTGDAVKPAVRVTWMGDTLAADKYTLSYANNVNVGTATVTATGKGECAGYSMSKTFSISSQSPSRQPMHRLYNPNSGEHFYTADDSERDGLVALGWNNEGDGWTAPETSNTPVFRMYNPVAGEHHYTPNAGERDNLIAAGWNDEGVGWYSDDSQTTPLFRDYNPNAFANNHNYTASAEEHATLMAAGWVDEGIAWYGA